MSLRRKSTSSRRTKWTARLIFRLVAAAWLTALPAAAQEGAADRAQRLMGALVAAYPDFLAGAEGNEIVWKDGTRMPFDDGTGEKDFETRLDRPDLEDMFYAPYPLGRAGTPPAHNIDPGRVRFQPFFARMYGDCTKGEVAQHLADVVWLPSKSGQRLKASRINGVAEKLQAVSNELDKLPAAMTKFVVSSAGTYNCRVVAGTNRVSAHGLGVAIDIAVAQQRLLVLGEARPRRPLCLQEPHPLGDRRDLREARLHLGRQVVPLRYHALRVPPGDHRRGEVVAI